MTTSLVVVDGDRGEGIDKAVRRRLGEELGRASLSVSQVAFRMGETQQKLSRRMTGQKPWPITELYEFCQVAGISFVYVTTGIKEIPTPGRGPDGGGQPVPQTPNHPIRSCGADIARLEDWRQSSISKPARVA